MKTTRQISEDITLRPRGLRQRHWCSQRCGRPASATRARTTTPHNRRHCLRTAWHADLEVREATLLTDFHPGERARALSAVTSWDEYRLEGTANDAAQVAAPVLRFQNTLATESLQQDIRIASAGGASFDWLAGFFYLESQHERGDAGNRPMWLYDERSDDPAVGALHQALFGFAVAAAVRDARPGWHARRRAGHRLRQRVRAHDVAPLAPVRAQHGLALAGRAEGRAPVPGNERPGAERHLAAPARPGRRQGKRFAPRRRAS